MDIPSLPQVPDPKTPDSPELMYRELVELHITINQLLNLVASLEQRIVDLETP